MLSAAWNQNLSQWFQNKNTFARLALSVFLLLLSQPGVQANQALLPEAFESSSAILSTEKAESRNDEITPLGRRPSAQPDFLFAGPLTETGEIKRTFFSSVSEPRVLYVAADGLDSLEGSEKAPWKSFAHALSFLQPGDTLIIKEGVYSEPLQLTVSGTSTSPIKLVGLGEVVLDGKTFGSETAAISSNGESFYQLENLSIRDAPTGIHISAGSQYITMSGLEIKDCGISVQIKDSSNIHLKEISSRGALLAFSAEGRSRNLIFEKVKASGLTSRSVSTEGVSSRGFVFDSGVANVTLLDIAASDHQAAGLDLRAANIAGERITAFANGVNLETHSKNASIKNSIFYDARKDEGPAAGLQGIGVSVQAGFLNLLNVTLADNENIDLDISEHSMVRIENGIIARRSAGRLLRNQRGMLSQDYVLWFASEDGNNEPAGGTSLWAEPGFIDWERQNYRLSERSPAIEWSSGNSRAGEFDADGAPRVYGEALDAGAFEFQPSEI